MSSFSGNNIIGGYFENFVNVNCAPTDSPVAKEVMVTVSRIAQKLGMNSQYAGSLQKNTYIDGYSDVDIWIATNGKVVSNQERISFATELINELKSKGYTDVEGPDY